MATLCLSFPASEQIEAPESKKSKPNKELVAIFLQNQGEGKDNVRKIPEERKLREIYNWLLPLLTGQTNGVNQGGGGGLLGNLLGGGNNFAYPFPFRKR